MSPVLQSNSNRDLTLIAYQKTVAIISVLNHSYSLSIDILQRQM